MDFTYPSPVAPTSPEKTSLYDAMAGRTHALTETYRDLHVVTGDSLMVLRHLPSESVDSVVCDPPYAIHASRDVRLDLTRPTGPRPDRDDPTIGGRCRDCTAQDTLPGLVVCASCLRLLETASFADAAMLGQQSPNWHERATHSRGYADNDPVTFQRWCSLWLVECLRVLKPGGHLVAFGGTRTWHRLAVAAEDAGFEIRDSLAWMYATGFPKSVDLSRVMQSPSTSAISTDRTNGPTRGSDAERWDGWGTALKPAHEPIVFARKPMCGTVAANAARYGTGALNIGACRIPPPPESPQDQPRWPTNVFLDAEQAVELDHDATSGRPSRFFWHAKPGKSERVVVDGVSHPTVKPLNLMRELIRLVTPPGGTVLDPFAGSGTTVEACLLERRGCVAIERDPDYVPLIEARLKRRSRETVSSRSRRESGPVLPLAEPTLFELPAPPTS